MEFDWLLAVADPPTWYLRRIIISIPKASDWTDFVYSDIYVQIQALLICINVLPGYSHILIQALVHPLSQDWMLRHPCVLPALGSSVALILYYCSDLLYTLCQNSYIPYFINFYSTIMPICGFHWHSRYSISF